ncbi:MAG TPA: DUF4136 domain-containing protein [Candidatus Angelobacter sp.]|nr:DUF4136 domain-containing protein [Candidatus Angelobacter sp.]
MTTKMRNLFPLLLLFVLATSLAFGQKTQTDYDKTYDFSQHHSYYWLKVDVVNSLWQKRVQDEIDSELMAKGWTKGDGSGDLALSALGTTQTKTTLNTLYSGMGGGWGWGGGMATATTVPETYHAGTLIIDFFDGQSKRLVWRSIASDTLSDKPEKNQKKLEKAVNKMLKDFPPKPKKED